MNFFDMVPTYTWFDNNTNGLPPTWITETRTEIRHKHCWCETVAQPGGLHVKCCNCDEKRLMENV